MPAVPLVTVSESAASESQPRVLLLDDDPLGRMLTGRALRERGFEVIEFDRAEEALEAVEHGGFDCAVADMLMPDVDGIEFCRRLRSSPRGGSLPVLMLTSLDDDEATARACEAGATDYCIKSVNWTLLEHRIRQALRLRRLETVVVPDGAGAGRAGGGFAPGSFEWHPAARRLRGSAELFRLLDWADPPATVPERRVLALVCAADRRVLRRALAALLAGGPAVRREVDVVTRAGRTRRLRIDVRQVIADAAGGLEVCGAVHDVTPAGGRDATIYRLTHYDGLTGLPNRTWLLERLRRPRPPGARGLTGVAVLDLDRFDHVGEALGPSASERLLVEVAGRLRRLAAGARAAGWIDAVVNLRGREFALLLDGLPDAPAALAIGRDAVAALHEPFRVDAREVFLRASVGVHVDGPGGDDGAQRLARAELALRAAAAAGGNCALAFDPSMSEPGHDRLEMERDLHYALARGEMTMHYQPQVDAIDGRIVGFEALMRWTRGGRMQLAGKFIPLAEENGLIVPLGEWAIGRACEALAALHASGLPECVLSVNLSCQQLRTGRLPAVIAAALAANRLPAALLEVELTETGMMADPEVAVAQLKAVRALGAGLAVDDFGTGYSSLAYLTRLPLTTLKIDRSFVQDVHGSERSRAVARAIVALGANLQLRVVAEGVETVEQRDALLSLGCNLQQGFLYGRAVPLPEALALADRRAIRPRLDSLENVS